MNEIWKEIKEYEGMYEISNLGRVKSLSRVIYNRWGTTISREKILIPSIDNNGYAHTSLTKNKKKKTFPIHRLVAINFISNPHNLPEVNHKKEFEKSNNCIENLEWCTHEYNTNYGTRNERHHTSLRKPIYQLDKNNNLIKRWDYIKQVTQELKFDSSSITKCCKGKSKTYKGFKWSYVDESEINGIDCEELQSAVRKKGISILGGKKSKAYSDKYIRTKLYSDIQREIKRQFGLHSYKAIKRSQLEIALDIVSKYLVPMILNDEILLLNNQIQF
jgi:hypothetical protein